MVTFKITFLGGLAYR